MARKVTGAKPFCALERLPIRDSYGGAESAGEAMRKSRKTAVGAIPMKWNRAGPYAREPNKVPLRPRLLGLGLLGAIDSEEGIRGVLCGGLDLLGIGAPGRA